MISNIKGALHRVNPLVAAATLILAAMIPVLSAQQVSALALVDRSLTVSTTIPSDDLDAPDGSTYTVGAVPPQLGPGDPRNGTQVDHSYTFTPQSTAGANIKAFTISYCTTPFGYVDVANDCTLPNGFDAAAWAGSSITIGGQSFAITWSSGNKTLTLTNATGVSPAAPITLNFPATATDFFVNPVAAYIGATPVTQNPSGTYFAHVTTFTDNSVINNTTLQDEGTVASSIANSISIYTRVQETLNFSVEGDQAADGPSSDFNVGDACTPLTADATLRLGDANFALETGNDYFGKSYFRLATNSAYGAEVFYSGDTLRSGLTNTITANGATAAVSTPGVEQFGLGFDQGDTLLNVSDNIIGTSGSMTPSAEYADVDDVGLGYAFDSGSLTAPVPLASSTGVVQCDTGGLEYVANISADTEAGIYTTKINYIAAPSY